MQDLSHSINLEEISNVISRASLVTAVPGLTPPIWGDIEGVPLIHVKGLSSYWKNDGVVTYRKQMQDVISGLNGQGGDFYFLILGRNNQTNIFLGVGERKTSVDLVSILTGAFPGIILSAKKELNLGKRLEQEGFFRYRGRLSGVPMVEYETHKSISAAGEGKSAANNISSQGFSSPSSIERLIRGMQGTMWGYFLHAIPCSQEDLQKKLTHLLTTMSEVHSQTRLQIQKLVQETTKLTELTQKGETTSYSGEKANRLAEFVLSNLEIELHRTRNAQAEGAWEVDVHFFSPDQSALLRMQSLLRSVFHTGHQAPEPLRTFVCQSDGNAPFSAFSTLLSSSEVAHLSYLPHEEIPGYQIKDFTLFDVDFQFPEEENVINLGNIIDNGRDTGLAYNIPLSSLNHHVLVSGITGSGKTTTIQHLLSKLLSYNPPIPFLVIEPTKSEYRSLINFLPQTSCRQGISVYTLGDETVSPFRINPFQFEILDSKHFIQPQTHIDFLKSVFLAAFVLYPPMPYVLEICLHEIYIDRGWNLSTNRNYRLPEKYWDEASQWPVFPTFTDLYQKIDEVTQRLGYDEQLKMDIIASLQTRLKSMMVGGKGLMMNIQNDEGMHKILDSPCILELERIGDDEQKIFLMGLLLTRLFEYRRLQNQKVSKPQQFKHLTVIEEAHRILKAVPPVAGPDQANLRGQAIETFSNIISEIRAYGEGILISDQIPTRLALEAVKNTNLKIMHRLVAKDDREVLSAMTNMDDHQSRYMVMMPKGQTIVFNLGDDRPMLINIKPEPAILNSRMPTDLDIRQELKPIFSVDEIGMYLSKKGDKARWEISDSQTDDLLSDVAFQKAWRVGNLHFWLPDLNRINLLDGVILYLSQTMNINRDEVNEQFLRIIDKISWFDAYDRGRLYDWNYEEISQFSYQRSKALFYLCVNRIDDFEKTSEELSIFTRRIVIRDTGPFTGCVHCSNPCLFRFDLLPVIQDRVFISDLEFFLREKQSIEEICEQLVAAGNSAIRSYFNEDDMGAIPDLIICVLSQGLDQINLSHYLQRKIMAQVADLILTRGHNDV
jgi:hypothetical protein